MWASNPEINICRNSIIELCVKAPVNICRASVDHICAYIEVVIGVPTCLEYPATASHPASRRFRKPVNRLQSNWCYRLTGPVIARDRNKLYTNINNNQHRLMSYFIAFNKHKLQLQTRTQFNYTPAHMTAGCSSRHQAHHPHIVVLGTTCVCVHTRLLCALTCTYTQTKQNKRKWKLLTRE